MPQEWEWIAAQILHKLNRIQAGNALTREMLRRSREQIDSSERILATTPPKVWHPVKQPHLASGLC
jgi:hypothetical protein